MLVDFGISHRQPADEATPAFARGNRGLRRPGGGRRPGAQPRRRRVLAGATAFALLTGGPPRPGARPAWTGIDAERAGLVEYALRRGLSVDPARRPATASALIDALRGQLARPTTCPPRPPPSWAAAPRWRRWKPSSPPPAC